MDRFILNVSAGGIFSKFIFVIQNLKNINTDFEYVYVNNVDDRSLIGDDNIFNLILDQKKDKSLPTINCKHLGNYSKFSPIELSNNLQDYKKIIKKLKFNQNMINKIDHYLDKYKINEDYLGVHIRLCDMNKYHSVDYGVLSYDDFLKKIKEEKGENTKIFLSSDNKESIKKLKLEFGDDVIYLDGFIRGETESEDTLNLQLDNFKNNQLWEESFIEMILLSKCGKLICRTSNLNNVSIIYSNTIKKIIRL
jgi:hypothetical protein